jgi:hypothetical protein
MVVMNYEGRIKYKGRMKYEGQNVYKWWFSILFYGKMLFQHIFFILLSEKVPKWQFSILFYEKMPFWHFFHFIMQKRWNGDFLYYLIKKYRFSIFFCFIKWKNAKTAIFLSTLIICFDPRNLFQPSQTISTLANYFDPRNSFRFCISTMKFLPTISTLSFLFQFYL